MQLDCKYSYINVTAAYDLLSNITVNEVFSKGLLWLQNPATINPFCRRRIILISFACNESFVCQPNVLHIPAFFLTGMMLLIFVHSGNKVNETRSDFETDKISGVLKFIEIQLFQLISIVRFILLCTLLFIKFVCLHEAIFYRKSRKNMS